MNELNYLRFQSQFRLKTAWDNICKKYGRSFEDEADEIDLTTNEIIVDNGFVRKAPLIPFGSCSIDVKVDYDALQNAWSVAERSEQPPPRLSIPRYVHPIRYRTVHPIRYRTVPRRVIRLIQRPRLVVKRIFPVPQRVRRLVTYSSTFNRQLYVNDHDIPSSNRLVAYSSTDNRRSYANDHDIPSSNRLVAYSSTDNRRSYANDHDIPSSNRLVAYSSTDNRRSYANDHDITSSNRLVAYSSTYNRPSYANDHDIPSSNRLVANYHANDHDDLLGSGEFTDMNKVGQLKNRSDTDTDYQDNLRQIENPPLDDSNFDENSMNDDHESNQTNSQNQTVENPWWKLYE
jgi:hypothetical protein